MSPAPGSPSGPSHHATTRHRRSQGTGPLPAGSPSRCSDTADRLGRGGSSPPRTSDDIIRPRMLPRERTGVMDASRTTGCRTGDSAQAAPSGSTPQSSTSGWMPSDASVVPASSYPLSGSSSTRTSCHLDWSAHSGVDWRANTFSTASSRLSASMSAWYTTAPSRWIVTRCFTCGRARRRDDHVRPYVCASARCLWRGMRAA